MVSAEEVIRRLSLAPHPEGGFFRETFRDKRSASGERAASTAIYYLLPQGEVSQGHRVDATEIWHFYAGAPLELSLSEDGLEAAQQRLGNDLAAGERPQLVAPAGWGKAQKASGPGRSWAAPSRPDSSFRVSTSLRRALARAFGTEKTLYT